ncbi:prenyltransferase [Desulfonatronovibrio magnus]|uniref:prenyltransferase n=1 Tax=Desulfonatronovibrio magnus TaxID=698827 RepID=UPI0005EBA2CD|nr:prenyltransferase [Desulfonatronovibrio magnus]
MSHKYSHHKSNHTFSSWLQASRPPSQLYIFPPLLLGQLFAVQGGYPFSWSIFIICHLYGLACQLYIVFANDAADVVTDKRNNTYTIFSGGSRVLVEDKISWQVLMSAAAGAAFVCVIMGFILGLWYERWAPLVLISLGIILLWAYSYPPVRMSYRGGGEILQMLGLGILLPLTGFSAQSGDIVDFPWVVTIPLMFLALTCAMSTALPDEPSDRISNKRTTAVFLRVHNSQKIIMGLNLTAIALIVFLPIPGFNIVHKAGIAFISLLIWTYGLQLRSCLPGTNCLSKFVALMVGFSLWPLVAMNLILLYLYSMS